MAKNIRLFTVSFAKVYQVYVDNTIKKGRTQKELDEIIFWLTGYDKKSLDKQIKNEVSFRTFFQEAPKINPNASKITGVVCGVRVENVEAPLMKKIRYLDKLVLELVQGKKMESILRK